MSEELKPCPFCAGEADINKVYDTIYCVECGISFKVGIEFPKTKELISAWNRRPQPENPVLTLEELREMKGDPVWVVFDKIGEWRQYFNSWDSKKHGAMMDFREFGDECEDSFAVSDYGKAWLAYRSKLEESPCK
jgi:hypothetical protein